jgi:Leucine-rich repeat (LRR) protein
MHLPPAWESTPVAREEAAMPHRLRAVVVSFAVMLLAACENYDIKVNERVVYSPQPLFTDFEVPDQALRACLEQAIEDGVVTAAPRLTTLNCSHAGIADLTGLSTFTGLNSLKLSSNRVRNLVELGALTSLVDLYLDDNLVVDPVPLYELPALQVLDLSGNPNLQCPSSAAFLRLEAVTLPRHCR